MRKALVIDRAAAFGAALVVVLAAASARAEKLAVPAVASAPELADEAIAIDLLVHSALSRVSLVETGADKTATAKLVRAGTRLELDVSITGAGDAQVTAGDGDVVALANGMVEKIGGALHVTPQPVKPFALGQLRPYAEAIRLARTDATAAIAQLADASPAVGLGLSAIAPALDGLLTQAPTPTARLQVARAIGATDVVATIAAGTDATAAAARAFAAIDRADLAAAETALVNAQGGLAALGRAAIAAEHDDVRLGQLLDAALESDQHRAALALASTISPTHLSAAIYRTRLIPLAEKASPGVASRIGYAAAQAKSDASRALALISVRELDQRAVDGFAALLDAHKEAPKAVLARLRAELAMRNGEDASKPIGELVAIAPTDPRAVMYAKWQALPVAVAKPAPDAPAAAPTPHVEDSASGGMSPLLPIVGGVGLVLVIAGVILVRRKKQPPIVARPAPAPPPRAKLKIDMTTPPPGSQPLPMAEPLPQPAPAPAPVPEPRPSPSISVAPKPRPQAPSMNPFADIVAAGPPQMTSKPVINPSAAPRPKAPTASPLSAIADFDPLADAPPPPPPPVAVRPALGSDPSLAFGLGSSPQRDLAQFALDPDDVDPNEVIPEPSVGHLEHVNLVKFGLRPDAPSLASILEERHELPWLEAVGIADQVCAALGFVHSQGVSHGGVRTAAIFVGGRVARLAQPLRMGSPAEDIISVGDLLAEMLGGGEVPPRLGELVDALRSRKPRAIAQIRAAFKALLEF